MDEVERISRGLAMWHGQKMVGPGSMTLAARHGYGSWGHSAGKYADDHWREYTSAAEFVIAEIDKVRSDEAYNARCEQSERAG